MLGCAGIVIKVEVKVFVNVVPVVNPAMVPVPPVLVMFPVLAVVVALTCIPEMVKTSFLVVPELLYVIVITVADVTTPVAAVMFLPDVNVTEGTTEVLNSKFVGAVRIIVPPVAAEKSALLPSVITIFPKVE